MNKEDKKLLLIDLCSRLPHKVKCEINGRVEILDSICDDDGYYFNFIGEDKEGYTIDEVKPYLFPLSSMTEEQKNIYGDLSYAIIHSLAWDMQAELNKLVDWLNKNHLDWRGLIEKGLAIDATGLNIYK